jgi:hypothetical protein
MVPFHLRDVRPTDFHDLFPRHITHFPTLNRVLSPSSVGHAWFIKTAIRSDACQKSQQSYPRAHSQA